MKLNRIFTSHMVFAAGLPIRIYGEGRGRAKISFAGRHRTVVSDNDSWIVEFPPMEYGGPYDMEIVFETESILLSDIHVGDVYLFAGQSNMQFKLKESSANHSLYETIEKLRLFSTDRIEKTDHFTAKDGWVKCKNDEVGEWSAIGYLTGNEISKTKNVAVGIIACYQGASVIESWVPKGTLDKFDVPLAEKHSDHFEESFAQWNTDGALYFYALSQIIPFSVSAVVWYQGESDTALAEARIYADELSELISIWRNDFCNSELPFVIIQLADYIQRNDEGWRLVQKAQAEIPNILPNVTTVISADVCENDDIHPKTKHKLAKRVAKALL